MSDEAFDSLMSAGDPGLVVVTTIADGVRAGCLVGFHAQASLAPPHYCLWLSKANHTYRVALRATHLAVHLLGVEDTTWAERFGTVSGQDTDKFAGTAVEDGPGRAPLLTALPHWFAGRLTAVLDVGGDHVCFCLAVEDAAARGPLEVLRVDRVAHLEPGRRADERALRPQG